MAKSEHHAFCQGVKSLLYENGLGYIWENPENVKKNFHKTFRNRLYDQFRQYWQAKCKDSNANSLLHNLKKDYTVSKYLNKIKDVSIRRIFTKLRLSNHCLNECIGRYHQIERSERSCKICNSNEIENVSHFLLKCNAFSTERDHCFSQIAIYCPSFTHLTDENKLSFILKVNSENINCISILCSYVKNMYVKRQSFRNINK